jgi:hypothetical protein
MISNSPFMVSACVSGPISYSLLKVENRPIYDYSEEVFKLIKSQDGESEIVELRGTRAELKEIAQTILEIL